MSEKKHRVFVYGTLKKGIHNHHILANSDYIGEAYTLDTFRMYHVGFPVIRLSDHPDAKAVIGEVYDVDDATLARLDRLENEGVMYDRKKICVVLSYQANVESIIDANVSVYIGNDAYWDGHTPNEWTTVNVHDELEWHA